MNDPFLTEEQRLRQRGTLRTIIPARYFLVQFQLTLSCFLTLIAPASQSFPVEKRFPFPDGNTVSRMSDKLSAAVPCLSGVNLSTVSVWFPPMMEQDKGFYKYIRLTLRNRHWVLPEVLSCDYPDTENATILYSFFSFFNQVLYERAEEIVRIFSFRSKPEPEQRFFHRRRINQSTLEIIPFGKRVCFYPAICVRNSQ